MLTVSIGRWENAKPAPSLGWAGRGGGDRGDCGHRQQEYCFDNLVTGCEDNCMEQREMVKHEAKGSDQILAIDGGTPVRSEPLPLEFPGVHHMDDEEVEAAIKVLKSRSFFRYYGVDLQKEVEQFEEEFAQNLGVKHALAVSSGTGALHTALSALGIGPGQEVIVPAYLWVSVLAAVVNLGAIPVLADINETFCLDPADVERRITSRTVGIVLVHMSGAPGDAESIRAIADKRNLWLLEDCAQCNGGSIHGRKVGTYGDMAIFSFQQNKTISAGEGGCVTTNDDRLHQRAFASHDLGYARNEDGRLVLDDLDLCLWGRGYRLDELRGAVLRVQLRKLTQITRSMRNSKYRIRRVLEEYSAVRLRKILDPEGDTGAFLILTLHDPRTAKRVNLALREEGIITSDQGISNILPTEWGLHLYYRNKSLLEKASVDPGGFPWKLVENATLQHDYAKGSCPVADDLFDRSILLPIPSCLTTRDEDDIIAAFRKVLAQTL
jgi:dTDP-4-amino-4,6-dideoxygalactose transaminase